MQYGVLDAMNLLPAARRALLLSLLTPMLVSGQTPPPQPAAAPPAVQPGPPVRPGAPMPASRWTAAQIRESFDMADADSNGELTRAEAQNLSIMPRSFEDADQNKDGVLVRIEYEALFLR
jgi:hypothetical protein